MFYLYSFLYPLCPLIVQWEIIVYNQSISFRSIIVQIHNVKKYMKTADYVLYLQISIRVAYCYEYGYAHLRAPLLYQEASNDLLRSSSSSWYVQTTTAAASG